MLSSNSYSIGGHQISKGPVLPLGIKAYYSRYCTQGLQPAYDYCNCCFPRLSKSMTFFSLAEEFLLRWVKSTEYYRTLLTRGLPFCNTGGILKIPLLPRCSYLGEFRFTVPSPIQKKWARICPALTYTTSYNSDSIQIRLVN